MSAQTVRKPGSWRGFTLIELMISVTVFSIAMLAIMAAFLAATRIARNTELAGNTQDNARFASEEILNSLRNTGIGMSNGLRVNVPGGGIEVISPIYGSTPGTTNYSGSSDLWVIQADRQVMGMGCTTQGAGIPVTADNENVALPVACNATGGLVAGDYLAVTNLASAALLTGTSFPTPTTIDYAERAAGYSDAPLGYHTGDLVYRVKVTHFYVAPYAKDNNRPALFKASAVLGSTLAAPFVDAPNPVLVQTGIEDFQVSFFTDSGGQNDPGTYTKATSYSPNATGSNTFVPSTLRSVQITVVGLSTVAPRDNNNATISTNVPVTIEGHTASAAAYPGLYRNALTRRVELINLSPGSF